MITKYSQFRNCSSPKELSELIWAAYHEPVELRWADRAWREYYRCAKQAVLRLCRENPALKKLLHTEILPEDESCAGMANILSWCKSPLESQQ